ncbi:pentatricopeptide repeat-containing protein At3g29230-like [Silene latifolia]|uniref:pentatricopeptide repeat-containing protein At3g29230-like n=1 Tax=Silene latifolia TaxID=37657 RepID=UPI003D7795E3
MAFPTISITCCSRFLDLKSWNKAIKRHIQEGNVNQGLSEFVSMQGKGFYPDNFTFPILVNAASRRSLICLGCTLHGQAIKSGYSSDLYVQTSLLNMYSSFQDVSSAHKVFKNMQVKDVTAWNSMLDTYTCNGHIEEAAKLYESVPLKDVISFNIMISGYAKLGEFELAQTLFDAAPAKDSASWNSMILACILAGRIEEGRRLFDKVPQKNIVTWNTMVSGLLKSELYVEAIQLFDQMRTENIKPDHVTISGVLAACAHLGSIETGRELHIYVLENNLMCPEVATSLIDMYAKCGRVNHSMEVFYKSQPKDIFCWNAVISGLALNGHGFAALKLFDAMKGAKSLRPDDITFIALLSACSHSGLVQEGCSIFSSMKEFGISPKLEHYGCMVDLLGRANLVSQAYQLVESMPFKPAERIIGALLSACVIHQDMEAGRGVVKLLMDRDEAMSDGDYMMVSNLYASVEEWEEAARWRQKMKDEGVVKSAGCSVIELNGTQHRFLAGDLVSDMPATLHRDS